MGSKTKILAWAVLFGSRQRRSAAGLMIIERVELKIYHRLAAVGVGALTVIGIGTAVAASAGWGAAPVAGDRGGSLVEDFSYPNAGKILKEQHVKLISGDGNIEVADCDTPVEGDIGLIWVTTADAQVNGNGKVCFKVSGSTGFLAMEVPEVYEIRGDGQRPGTGHDITAVIKAEGGEPRVVSVDPAGSTQVGIAANPPSPATALLELKVTG